MTQAEHDRWLDTRAALRAMVDSFKPFTLKPIGAPGSQARLEQDLQKAAYEYAITVLALPVRSAEHREGCPSGDFGPCDCPTPRVSSEISGGRE